MKCLLPLLLVSCVATHSGSKGFLPEWTMIETGSKASLRGISVGKDGSVWASGSGGTILRSLDQGNSWSLVGPKDPDGDFRDVEGIDAQVAFAMRITEPAQVIYTENGGASWDVVYESELETSFFDSIALLKGGGSVVFGDPQEGVFEVLRSDHATDWRAVPAANLPKPKQGEAAFAASGTCVAAFGDRVWIGTGGQAARVFYSDDRGRSWEAVETHMRQDTATAGIYSVAFRDRKHGVIVGGDYQQPDLVGGNAATSQDGGRTWILSESPPWGYRSGVAAVPGWPQYWIAVGRTGCDFTDDGGQRWTPTSPRPGENRAGMRGFFAIAFGDDGIGYAVGSEGGAARIRLKPHPIP